MKELAKIVGKNLSIKIKEYNNGNRLYGKGAITKDEIIKLKTISLL